MDRIPAKRDPSILRVEFNQMNIVFAACLVFVAPFVMYNPAQFYLLMILSVFIFVIKGIKQKSFLEKTPLDIPIFLLLVSIWISSVFVANPFHSFQRAVNILLYVLLFYALVSLLRSRVSMDRGIVGFLALCVFSSLLALTGMLHLNTKHFEFLSELQTSLPSINLRLPGAVEGIHPNAVGGLVILFIPVLFMLVFFRVDEPERMKIFLYKPLFKWSAVFGLIISVSVLILTQSRGAWVGLFFGILAMIIVGAKRKKRTIGVSLVLILLILFFLNYSFTRSQSFQGMVSQVEDTIDFRISLWELALKMIQTHPFLGIGLNEFRYHFEMDYKMSHAHNSFLNIAVELGLPTVVVYMMLLIGLFYMTLSTWNRFPFQWSSYLILALGSGHFAYVIFSFTDTIRLGARAGIFFWISAAFITAIYSHAIKYHNGPECQAREHD